MPNRIMVKIIGNNGSTKKTITEIIRQSVKEAGYTCKLKTYEPDVILEFKPDKRQ